MYLFGSMPCVSIMTSPSELGEVVVEERGESFQRPRRALDITPPAPALPPVAVVVVAVVVNGGKFSLVRW